LVAEVLSAVAIVDVVRYATLSYLCTMTEQSDEFDSPWKNIVETYFQDFMQFFFPAIHDDIDWNRGYDFLDQELRQVVRDAELGKRLVDKLVKVWKISGEETWVLVHLEIQSQEERQFSTRIFVYYYRLRDRYNQKIVSLAILGDERESWRPQPFMEELWGCRVNFKFPIVKLLDYAPRWAELEESRNPFAIAVMAHLKTKETKRDAVARKEWKFRLTRRLYEQGYERQDILNLFRFLDWLMELPEGLKQAFRIELEQYEQEKKMPYVTSIEQMSRQEGREEERTAIALSLLSQNVAIEVISQATGLTIAQLQQLQNQITQG
jgi:hypothetical protein